MRRLALGTAQFGLDYGIANNAGKVHSTLVARILTRAWQEGVDTLDTAIAYGDSEARLGAAGVEGWRVITKLPALPSDVVDVTTWVETSIAGSLRRLGLASVDAVLLHRSSDLLGERGQALARALDGLVAAGSAVSVGVSIYDPSELDHLWSRWHPQIVQAPFNVLDRRLAASGWLARLVKQGIRVHVRSVFLQGLLVMNPAQRPVCFSRWADLLDRWHGWCAANGLTPQAVALAFVAAQKEIERFVIGVDSLQQLEQLLQPPVEVPLPPAGLRSDDRELIEPSRWKLS
jgi:aryl-alcohol dehydrogenase-like predicted oxidoreductase